MNNNIRDPANQIILVMPASLPSAAAGAALTKKREEESLEVQDAHSDGVDAGIGIGTGIGTGAGTGKSGNLFVGSLEAAESNHFLSCHGITHVLTVAKSLPVNIPENPNHDSDRDASTTTTMTTTTTTTTTTTACRSRIKHLVVECLDHPMANILEVLDECLAFMREGLIVNHQHQNHHNDNDNHNNDNHNHGTNDQRGGNVLVHCASGVSRSVTVCAAYLMKYHQWNWSEAVRHISSTRKYANPNIGFRRQLQILQDSGGDINVALETYAKYNVDVISDTIRQRDVVNRLHAKVDELENELAKLRSIRSSTCADTCMMNAGDEIAGHDAHGNDVLNNNDEGDDEIEDHLDTTTVIAKIKFSLCALQTELDSCLPTDSEGLVDPPARMIRKSASKKVERLLELI